MTNNFETPGSPELHIEQEAVVAEIKDFLNNLDPETNIQESAAMLADILEKRFVGGSAENYDVLFRALQNVKLAEFGDVNDRTTTRDKDIVMALMEFLEKDKRKTLE